MHAVRKHILEILKEQHSGATVAELAELLKMAPVSVRHHLDILQGDNLICVERLERKGNVGRPQQVYALTEEANGYFPNNFAALAGGLVGQIKQMLPPDKVPCAFRAIAQEMAAEFFEEKWSNCSDDSSQRPLLERKLEEIAAFLTERGYLARWELVAVNDKLGGAETGDDKTGDEQFVYLLHKYNCPYAGVSSEHSELCLMDQTLMNELTGCDCERLESLANGASCCTYRLGAESTTPKSLTEKSPDATGKKMTHAIVLN